MNTLSFLEEIARNVRFSLRALRRSPGFAAAAILTLAIGIGADTAVFSVVNSVLLKPPPYPEAGRLVSVQSTSPGAPGLMSASGDLRHSASMFFTYADHNRSFDAIGGWPAGAVTVTGQGEPEEVRATFVTKGALEALGGARGPALSRGEVLTARAMDVSAIVKLVGGLGMFLLGIHHLTEGIKDLAGDSLRRALTRLVAGRVSAIASGVVFTALIQSSTAAILTVIGFISAGLMTFVQSIGVIMGATLGTTSTPWMVAYFGFRVRIASFAMPMLGVGALLWLVAKGRARSLGAVIAGFGLLFTGIDYMQNGMKGVTWNFEGFSGPGSMWLLAAIGIGMTIVMQSSSAAAATTLVALNAGALSFEQACALIVGQSIGTTGTTALVMIGAGLAVRRAALAHILFSAIVGLLGMVFLGPLTAAAEWVGSPLDDPDGVLAVAAFSSIFKFAGIVVFFPFMNRFAGFISRITGGGSESAASRLEPTLYDAGGAVALEAGQRAILEIARGAIDAVRRSLAGEPVTYTPPAADVRRTIEFLESLSIETTDTGTIGPGLVRLAHALDHLERLHEDLARAPAPTQAWQPPPGFGEGAQALAPWLEATQEPGAAPNAGVLDALEKMSARLREECRAVREQLLEDIALQRVRTLTARAGLEQLAWADSALHHAAGVAKSLHGEAGE